MDRWLGKVAVVTGVGGGIGAAVAEKLVDAGLQVVGIDISQDLLDQVSLGLSNSEKIGKFHPVKASVSDEDEIVGVFNWIKEKLGAVGILVNCAGLCQNTSLHDGDVEKWKKVLDVNVLGLCIVTREAVRSMKANDVSGHIVHLNSITGHKVPSLTGLNVYPASKFAVTALTDGLRYEFNQNDLKIKVTSISPGFVNTDLIPRNNMQEHLVKAVQEVPLLDPEDIADAIIYALSTPPHVQIQELTIKPVGEEY